MLPPGAVKPDYSGYCLSNVPTSIMSLFGLHHQRPTLPKDAFGDVETSGAENVVLLLCDGLGYNQWTRQESRGFFGRFSSMGSVRPITTVFPSTTAAAITTVSTGLTPQEHGLPEWFVYMDELGEVIVTLPFTRVGETGRDTLEGELDPKVLFDGETVFEKLSGGGINCTSFSSRYLANSAYSRISRAGSAVVPYTSASDLTVSLRRRVEKSRGRNFFYVYWSLVDTVEHVFGPDTEEAAVETSLISHAFEEGFLSKLDRSAAKKTLMMVVADHGQLQIRPEETVYLNRFRRLVHSFGRNPSGGTIPPWGSARDCYLRVDEAGLEDTKDYLEKKLDGVATVLKTDDAIAMGLFGLNSATPKFRKRVGNLLILPHGNGTVWYRYERGNDLDLRGHHGGLTADEMQIPLASARVSDLQ